ncbi:STAS domain-containing protein [Streptomyces sp. TG1A-8]|uniref:STAS domain-containing protein n=1 Tax=Streptomyces sp. TG1A-8 TaxID=3051385 RepID=UPI00265B78AB|nr:STAS domain-containing protein [Streptomyces sp. TG1A-8]MDO0925489.1 STAS domain-containing protein [Streptomyces sp. TG1A-8]
MSTDLQVTVRETRVHQVVVAVTGSLDHRTTAGFHQQTAALMTARRHMVLDMSQVTFCDSSGLNTLLLLLRQAQINDTTLTLTAVPAQMRRLLATTGADTVLGVRGGDTGGG